MTSLANFGKHGQRIDALTAPLRAFAARHGPALSLMAGTAFLAGMILAARQLGLDWTALRPGPLLVAVLFGLPGLALNGAELSISARAAGGHLSFLPAVRLSSLAAVANMLPLPAGAAIRGGALMKTGATAARSAGVLLAVAILWLALASAITFALIEAGMPGNIAAGLCALVAAGAAGWLWHRTGYAAAMLLVAIRILLIGLAIARLHLCFLALGAETGILDAALYTAAPVVGAAIGIMPGGLGISEGVGAALALAAGASPALAFVALGLSRFLGLALAGSAVMLFPLLPVPRAVA